MRRKFRRAKPKPKKELYRTNDKILAAEVRVITESGEILGVMTTADARAKAEEMEMDLVEVSPKAQPPVVKIADYGKMKYKVEKLASKQKAKQKKTEVKDIRLSLRISAHDLDMRYTQALKFLQKGNKIKLEIILRGREKQLKDKAREILDAFVKRLESEDSVAVTVEQPLTRQANGFNMILANKK
jgi:translation initiation factor IF-3